jgi:hypothetical protein
MDSVIDFSVAANAAAADNVDIEDLLALEERFEPILLREILSSYEGRAADLEALIVRANSAAAALHKDIRFGMHFDKATGTTTVYWYNRKAGNGGMQLA